MIATAKSVAHGSALIDYSFRKQDCEVIKCNFLPDKLSPNAYYQRMLIHQAQTRHCRDQRKEIDKNFVSVVFSPTSEETRGWTADQWRDTVMEWIGDVDNLDLSTNPKWKNVKPTCFANSQYIVVLHHDSKGQIDHTHLIINRVDMNGHTNDTSFIGERAVAAAHVMNIERGWELPEDIERDHKQQITNDCLEILRRMSRFSWSEYKRRVEDKGYKLALRLDREGKVVGYSIIMGNSKYKASKLADTKMLTASKIESTWRKLHQPTAEIKFISGQKGGADKPIEVVKPKLIAQDIEVDGRHYRFDIPLDIFATIDKAIEPSDETPRADHTDLLRMAVLLFAGYVDAATSISQSCGGGGGGSTQGWGKDPKEDEFKWAMKCARQACRMAKPLTRRFRR